VADCAATRRLAAVLLGLFLSAVVVTYSAPLYLMQNTSEVDDLVPVFLVICFGLSVTNLAFAHLRLANAREILDAVLAIPAVRATVRGEAAAAAPATLEGGAAADGGPGIEKPLAVPPAGSLGAHLKLLKTVRAHRELVAQLLESPVSPPPAPPPLLHPHETPVNLDAFRLARAASQRDASDLSEASTGRAGGGTRGEKPGEMQGGSWGSSSCGGSSWLPAHLESAGSPGSSPRSKGGEKENSGSRAGGLLVSPLSNGVATEQESGDDVI